MRWWENVQRERERSKKGHISLHVSLIWGQGKERWGLANSSHGGRGGHDSISFPFFTAHLSLNPPPSHYTTIPRIFIISSYGLLPHVTTFHIHILLHCHFSYNLNHRPKFPLPIWFFWLNLWTQLQKVPILSSSNFHLKSWPHGFSEKTSSMAKNTNPSQKTTCYV